eukprot:6728030-Alexandrium_andersonii.AAC.1
MSSPTSAAKRLWWKTEWLGSRALMFASWRWGASGLAPRGAPATPPPRAPAAEPRSSPKAG